MSDCQVLIAGGMGQPAYERALVRGLEGILTGERRIDQAVAEYAAGRLNSDRRRVRAYH